MAAQDQSTAVTWDAPQASDDLGRVFIDGSASSGDLFSLGVTEVHIAINTRVHHAHL